MITYDGQFTRPQAIKAARTTYPIQNFNSLKLYDQDYVQLAETYTVPQIGITHPVHSAAILVEESNFSNLPGGLFSFTRTFCEFPGSEYTEPVLINYTFPGFKNQYPTYKVENGIVSIDKYEDVIWSSPTAKQSTGRKLIKWHNLLDAENNTFETITFAELATSTAIQYKNQIYYPLEIYPNESFDILVNGVIKKLNMGQQGGVWDAVEALADGFNFNNLQSKIIKPFKVTDKKKVTVQVNNNSSIGSQEQLSPFDEETTFCSPTSSPTWAEYKNMISTGHEIVPFETEVTKFMGSIYTTATTYLKAL
tara:strand:+ start:3042 stop:3965 length:924 start_codon:yes stop_codon:yes gene_type:complete